jgi:hypothetical protein
MAINTLGQVIDLPVTSVRVTLARKAEMLPLNVGQFEDCEPASSDLNSTGEGAYVLAITTASAFRERAPMIPVGSNGTSTACGDAYAVAGVAFRLIEIPRATLSPNQATRDHLTDLMAETDDLTLTDATRRARVSMVRNLLAHLCFGTEDRLSFRQNPWRRDGGRSPFLTYGAIDRLRATGDLRPCDVPLGLIFWSRTGLKYADPWAVRRRPVPLSVDALWPLAQGPRALIESEAVFLQFQDHVEAIVRGEPTQAALSALHATDYFRFLPPAGMLPLQAGSGRGFDSINIFVGVTTRERVFIDGSRWHHLLRTSLHYLPIDLQSHELIWQYLVRENEQAIENTPIQPPLLNLTFSSGHMPFQGDAQFDLARWNLSNYGLGVSHTHETGG